MGSKSDRPRGRPSEESSSRDQNLTVRVNQEELALYERAAQDAERTLSDWVRLTLRHAAGHKR